MFECYGCHTKYEDENAAIECCTNAYEYGDGYICLPRKSGKKPFSTSHYCPNVKAGDRSWSTMLRVDEKCPMCDYAYMPR